MEINICSRQIKNILSLRRLSRAGRTIELHRKKAQVKLLCPSNSLIRTLTIKPKKGKNHVTYRKIRKFKIFQKPCFHDKMK